MIKRIKLIFTADANKRLSSNIFSLGSLQIANYILPLVTIPYLVRVIGIENFGLLAFVTAVTMYFLLLSDYGFNLSATKQISDNREDLEACSKIFSEVLGVKFILVITSLLVLSFLMLFEFFNQNTLIYFLTFGMVVGHALFPVWFFQGMEAMKYIAIINVASKTFFTLLIFVFVNEQQDYWMVPLLTSLGFLAAGLYALFIAIKKYKIKVVPPSRHGLMFQLQNGWHVFLSRIYVNLYTTTNIVLLGLLTNNTVVGYYSIAEKILQAFSGLFSPVLQAFYPYLANLYKKSKEQFFELFKKLNLILLVVSTVVALFAGLTADTIVWLIAGEHNENIVVVFTVLAFAIITAPFGPSYTNGLLVLGEAKKVSEVVFYTMLLNMIIVVPLIIYFGAIGLAITWVVGQLFHVSFYLYKYKIIQKEIKN